ncbi:hypothetical protein SLITO_v1c08780 [Spiroplasma litorale]|uniref:PTS EIIB type-1 domain-containing protein n=1 Tax=Spiroplasma litorale TaxID=216942 RepID=A0A0K1W2U0_9MOLU|nr:hypothetical protein [Spiroplasma litorale]AKX34493.1 hypothetical protein SLITO_v1c08780 [Spiroplasma litorale]
MLITVLTIFSVIFLIFLISLIIHLNLRKYKWIKNEKYKLENNEKAFTYKNILNALGGLENIDKVDKDKVYLISVNLVSKKKLLSFNIKHQIEENYIVMSVKGFNINLFLNKLKKQLEKETT